MDPFQIFAKLGSCPIFNREKIKRPYFLDYSIFFKAFKSAIMITQFFSIALIALLGAMLPGPDFAIVAKNSLLHSRRSGYFTSFGVGAAILIHMSYCIFGVALIISSSLLLFNLIKYIGASYLIYLGVSSLLSKQPEEIVDANKEEKTVISNFVSFKQGFLCNLLNPKATLFFLSLFTVIIKPETPFSWEVVYGLEIAVVATTWFCGLTVILSHPYIKRALEKAEKYIAKFLGIFLIGFGIALVFIRHH
jgi:RhtB (resistance to homoserine/threonine) family protein